MQYILNKLKYGLSIRHYCFPLTGATHNHITVKFDMFVETNVIEAVTPCLQWRHNYKP